jgi:murein L,D-transpeptidase YcbB/YkuD
VVGIQSGTRSRRRSPGQLDDWFAGGDEFDWPHDPLSDDKAVGAPLHDGGESHTFEPVASPPASEAAGPRPDAATVLRRRRILALAALGLAIATALAIVLATAGGRSGKPASRAEAGSTSASSASTTAPASGSTATATRPATTVQTRTQPKGSTATKTKASSTNLRVTLPSNAALSIGDSGQAVTRLQKALAKLGYDVGADGSFGTATETAVKALQKANGLTADGIVGSATVQKLNQALASS